jgi:hypothetical protein
MEQELKHSVIRILDNSLNPIGTGFVVNDNGLVVTCAHVVSMAKSAPGCPINIQYKDDKEIMNMVATVFPEPNWSSIEEDDVAYLQIDQLPSTLFPVMLGSSDKSEDNQFKTFGFPSSGISFGSYADGKIEGLTSDLRGEKSILQISGDKIEKGMSGAPILDLERNLVVAMIYYGEDKKYARSMFGIPTETIIQYNHNLKIEDLTYEIIKKYFSKILFYEPKSLEKLLEKFKSLIITLSELKDLHDTLNKILRETSLLEIYLHKDTINNQELNDYWELILKKIELIIKSREGRNNFDSLEEAKGKIESNKPEGEYLYIIIKWKDHISNKLNIRDDDARGYNNLNKDETKKTDTPKSNYLRSYFGNIIKELKEDENQYKNLILPIKRLNENLLDYLLYIDSQLRYVATELSSLSMDLLGK